MESIIKEFEQSIEHHKNEEEGIIRNLVIKIDSLQLDYCNNILNNCGLTKDIELVKNIINESSKGLQLLEEEGLDTKNYFKCLNGVFYTYNKILESKNKDLKIANAYKQKNKINLSIDDMMKRIDYCLKNKIEISF